MLIILESELLNRRTAYKIDDQDQNPSYVRATSSISSYPPTLHRTILPVHLFSFARRSSLEQESLYHAPA